MLRNGLSNQKGRDGYPTYYVGLIEPLFNLGDFVACDYAQILIFSYYDEDELDEMKYYGIVVYIDYSYHEFMDEFVYEILCLDGQKRYFMESELCRINP